MSVEEQIEARKRLLFSAKMARTQGFSRTEWQTAEQIRDFCLQSGLEDDILVHIAAWVWTFRR